MTLDELKEAVVSQLSIELRDEANFNEAALLSKVQNAIEEVKFSRRYPSNYTESMIADDMVRFYSNVYKIALFDYNQIGIDFQSGHSENGINRSFSDRNKLFYGVIPIARV